MNFGNKEKQMTNELKNKFSIITTFEAKDGSMITFRPAQLMDGQGIIAKAASIVREGKFIQKERVRSLAEEEQFITDMNTLDNMYTVIEMGGEVVGIARIIRGELEMKRHVGLFRTWLAEEGQGKGIGKKIMEYAIGWAHLHKLQKVSLTVFSGNTVAKQLYEKSGFVIEGVLQNNICINGTYQDEIYMSYFI